MIWTPILIALTTSAWGFDGGKKSFQIRPAQKPSEVLFHLKYALSCTEDLPLVVGHVEYQGRKIRILLPEGKEESTIGLGPAPSNATPALLVLDSNPSCSLSHVEGLVDYEPYVQLDALPFTEAARAAQIDYHRLALEHWPVIYSKDNQSDPYTDVPLFRSYTIQKSRENNVTVTTITFVDYYSDSDQRKSAEDIQKKIYRSGHSLDIRWVYAVKFDPLFRVLSRHYPSLVTPKGEARFPQSEEHFLPGSSHPVLVSVAGNRFLAPGYPSAQGEFYQLVPRSEDKTKMPMASEWKAFDEPWMFWISERELVREKKLPFEPEDQLYVLVDGELRAGTIHVEMILNTGSGEKTFENGKDHEGIEAMGTDMWGRQSFTALRIGREVIEKLAAGDLTGSVKIQVQKAPQVRPIPENKPGLWRPDIPEVTVFKPKSKPRFLILKKVGRIYQKVEISRHFHQESASQGVRLRIRPRKQGVAPNN